MSEADIPEGGKFLKKTLCALYRHQGQAVPMEARRGHQIPRTRPCNQYRALSMLWQGGGFVKPDPQRLLCKPGSSLHSKLLLVSQLQVQATAFSLKCHTKNCQCLRVQDVEIR